jgi:hypothetical protein
VKQAPDWLLWFLAMAALPASWLAIQAALILQTNCADFENYPDSGCSKTPENMCWILALALIIAFAWAVDRLIKRRNGNAPEESDDLP